MPGSEEGMLSAAPAAAAREEGPVNTFAVAVVSG
jgi:hypothetical protein